MKRIVPLISVFFVAATAFPAAEQPKKTAPAKTQTAVAPTEAAPASDAPVKIEVKNKSSFTFDANSRNPFWPIGWKPAAKLAGNSADQGGDIPVSAFLVSSITLEQGAHFAIINGKTMQEGQQFGLMLGNQTYQIVLKRIEDGRVVLSRHDQEIVVLLRRK
jgi:hypothetical protein